MIRPAAFALPLALAGCENAPPRPMGVEHGRPGAPLAPPGVALTQAEVATLDPQTMDATEIAKALGPGPSCGFAYVKGGAPILAVRGPRAVTKLNGWLVELQAAAAPGATVFAADGLRFTLATPEDEDLADLHFTVGDQLDAGYRGQWRCTPPPAARARPEAQSAPGAGSMVKPATGRCST